MKWKENNGNRNGADEAGSFNGGHVMGAIFKFIITTTNKLRREKRKSQIAKCSLKMSPSNRIFVGE